MKGRLNLANVKRPEVHDRHIILRCERLLQSIAERLGMTPMRQELLYHSGYDKETVEKKLQGTHHPQSRTGFHRGPIQD